MSIRHATQIRKLQGEMEAVLESLKELKQSHDELKSKVETKPRRGRPKKNGETQPE